MIVTVCHAPLIQPCFLPFPAFLSREPDAGFMGIQNVTNKGFFIRRTRY